MRCPVENTRSFLSAICETAFKLKRVTISAEVWSRASRSLSGSRQARATVIKLMIRTDVRDVQDVGRVVDNKARWMTMRAEVYLSEHMARFFIHTCSWSSYSVEPQQLS